MTDVVNELRAKLARAEQDHQAAGAAGRDYSEAYHAGRVAGLTEALALVQPSTSISTKL